MDYSRIPSVIESIGLSNDPALRGTVFVVEPIPSFNGCPLGLYDPNINTIILPPDFLEATVIHEVGHRIGHYYYDDLSEVFAEDFRQRFSAGETLIATPSDLASLPMYESLFQEGDRGAVEIQLDKMDIAVVQQAASAYPQLSAFYRGNTLRIPFIKGNPMLALISAFIIGIGTAFGLRLFKE